MKKQMIFILSGILILAMVGAGAAYRVLQEQYKPETDTGSQNESVNTAPDFTVQDDAGQAVRLSDFSGKPMVVNFWATWCGPCKSELPAFEAAYHAYKDEVGFMMVNLTDGQRETVEAVKAFIDQNGYSFPVYYDTEYSASQAYGVYSVPLTVFIDADGTIQNAQIGAMSADVLEGYLQELTGG